MSERSGHELSEWFHAHGITEVECLVSDLTGILKGKIMPAGKYLNGGRTAVARLDLHPDGYRWLP